VNLQHLLHGQIEETRVAPLGPDDRFPAAFATGSEVRLRYSEREEVAFLEVGDTRLAVRGVGRGDSLALSDLCTRNLPRLAWIAEGLPESALLRVHTFLYERVVSELQMGVDEKVAEALARRQRLGSVREAIDWLADQLLIPDGAGEARAFATVHEEGAGFVLHGRTMRAVIRRVGRPGEETLRVERVIRSPARGTDEAPTLLRGNLRFGDATAAGSLAVEAAAELSALVSAGSSFLDVWRRYGDLENETALRRGGPPRARAQ
jgi:hypothetical protein